MTMYIWTGSFCFKHRHRRERRPFKFTDGASGYQCPGVTIRAVPHLRDSPGSEYKIGHEDTE